MKTRRTDGQETDFQAIVAMHLQSLSHIVDLGDKIHELRSGGKFREALRLERRVIEMQADLDALEAWRSAD